MPTAWFPNESRLGNCAASEAFDVASGCMKYQLPSPQTKHHAALVRELAVAGLADNAAKSLQALRNTCPCLATEVRSAIVWVQIQQAC